MATIRKTIVVAVSRNGVIGRDGDMPWRLSTDLRRFKALTSGKPVIMGRKTFNSIGKPLPERVNIAITRDTDFAAEGVIVAHSLDEAIAAAVALAREADVEEICIIGGGEIYRQAMAIADTLHVTHVEATIDGDTVFPDIEDADWRIESEVDVPTGEKDNFATRFVTYQRR